MVLQSVFEDAKLLEWFEYDGTPGTFRIEVSVPENGVTDEQQDRILENISLYKNVRSHMETINYTYESRGELKAGAFAATIAQVEVMPKLVECIDITAQTVTCGAVITWCRMEVYPASGR
jgi:P2-related tail formation protein